MKKSPLFWIMTAILGLVALTFVLNVFGQLVMQPYFSHGQGGGFHHHDLRMLTFGLSFLPFLFHLGLIVLGWWIWRKANGESVKKWVGIILLTVGMFSILPLIIVIPVLLIAVYFIVKGKTQSDSEFIADPIIVSSLSYSSNTNNILDEWERKNK